MFKNLKNTINLEELYKDDYNSIKLKNEYTLTILFHKNNYSFKNILYKILFKSKYSHISFILDDKYHLEISFESGTNLFFDDSKELVDIIDYDFYKYEKLTDIVKIIITKDEYYKISKILNKVKFKKYDYLSIFKNLRKNNSLYNKNRYICTEVAELILVNINIKVNNRYNVTNLYNNLIKKLKEKNKKFYLI